MEPPEGWRSRRPRPGGEHYGPPDRLPDVRRDRSAARSASFRGHPDQLSDLRRPWMRGAPRCKACGGSDLVTALQCMGRTPRGNQRAVVGRREISLCVSCDAQAWHTYVQGRRWAVSRSRWSQSRCPGALPGPSPSRDRVGSGRPACGHTRAHVAAGHELTASGARSDTMCTDAHAHPRTSTDRRPEQNPPCSHSVSRAAASEGRIQAAHETAPDPRFRWSGAGYRWWAILGLNQ